MSVGLDIPKLLSGLLYDLQLAYRDIPQYIVQLAVGLQIHSVSSNVTIQPTANLQKYSFGYSTIVGKPVKTFLKLFYHRWNACGNIPRYSAVGINMLQKHSFLLLLGNL